MTAATRRASASAAPPIPIEILDTDAAPTVESAPLPPPLTVPKSLFGVAHGVADGVEVKLGVLDADGGGAGDAGFQPLSAAVALALFVAAAESDARDDELVLGVDVADLVEEVDAVDVGVDGADAENRALAVSLAVLLALRVFDADGVSVVRGDVPTVLVAVAVPVAVFVAVAVRTGESVMLPLLLSLLLELDDDDAVSVLLTRAETVSDDEPECDRVGTEVPLLPGDADSDRDTTAVRENVVVPDVELVNVFVALDVGVHVRTAVSVPTLDAEGVSVESAREGDDDALLTLVPERNALAEMLRVILGDEDVERVVEGERELNADAVAHRDALADPLSDALLDVLGDTDRDMEDDLALLALAAGERDARALAVILSVSVRGVHDGGIVPPVASDVVDGRMEKNGDELARTEPVPLKFEIVCEIVGFTDTDKDPDAELLCDALGVVDGETDTRDVAVPTRFDADAQYDDDVVKDGVLDVAGDDVELGLLCADFDRVKDPVTVVDPLEHPDTAGDADDMAETAGDGDDECEPDTLDVALRDCDGLPEYVCVGETDMLIVMAPVDECVLETTPERDIVRDGNADGEFVGDDDTDAEMRADRETEEVPVDERVTTSEREPSLLTDAEKDALIESMLAVMDAEKDGDREPVCDDSPEREGVGTADVEFDARPEKEDRADLDGALVNVDVSD